jgi:predicted porin
MKTQSTLMLAMAAMLPAAAFAQSSVQIYGTIDGGLRYQTNVDAAGNHLLSATSGNYYSNRLGFRGKEDLGNGLNAHFQLESGFKSDTGELDNANNVLFNRTAAVGLGGAWGSIDVGRQYTVGFRTEKFLDPFNHHYTPLIPLASGAGTSLPAAAKTAGLTASSNSGTRFNNDVQYTGTFGGLTLRAEYSAGEIADDAGKGSAQGAAFSYTGSTLLAAGAYIHKETPAGFTNNMFVAGGGFKWKGMTVKAGVSRERQESASAGTYQNESRFGGISYQVSEPVDLTAAIYRSVFDSVAGRGAREMIIVGGTYYFSKRTNLYAEFDVNRYDGALIPASNQTSQHGISLGVMHAF